LGGSACNFEIKIKSYPLIGTPPAQPSPPKGGEGEREQIGGFSDREFDSQLQVGATRINAAISPLSLRERVRVRAAV